MVPKVSHEAHTTAMIDGNSICIKVEMIGPERAEQLLAYNTRNRNKKPGKIQQYAADMASGDWLFSAAGIAISEEPKTLLDGQNRLFAVIESGATVPFLVVSGIKHRAQDRMDTNASRSFGDALSMRGESNTNTLAALVRRCAGWEAGKRRNLMQHNDSHAQLDRFLDSHPELRDYTGPAVHVGRKIAMPPSNIGLLWWVFDKIDEDDAGFFFARLADGDGLSKGHPIYELRRTLASDDAKGGNAQFIRQLAIVIKAWNAYRAGDTVTLYRWRPGGANPEQFPEPK